MDDLELAGSLKGKRMKILDLQPIPAQKGAWRARLMANGGRAQEFHLETDDGISPPDVLDGLALAALPVAIRGGFDLLRVHGPITHGALWRLLEYARIWHLWSPGHFHPTRIEPDQVLRGLAPDPAGLALVAWSGSLHSSHTLIRMIEHRAVGTPAVGGVMRMTGLRRGDHAGIEAAREMIQAMGLRFHHIRTNARHAGMMDGRLGRLPMIAAAMHCLSRQYNCGIHARGYPLAAQMIFPRPGPALPDLYSGDALAIRADGGIIPLPLAARALARYPILADMAGAAVSRCPRSEQTLVRLAFRAAGVAGMIDDWQDAIDAFLLPVGRGTIYCEARGICDHWTGSGHGIRKMLAARIRMGQIMMSVRDYGRWLLAMAHLRGVYPR